MTFPSELPTGFEIGEEMMMYVQLHTLYAKSAYGQRLALQIRFSPYKPPQMTAERWKEHLGTDVDNLGHLLETWRGVKRYLGLQMAAGKEYAMRDLENLQIAAIIHDCHEGMEGVGDVLDTRKNNAARNDETAQLRFVIQELFEAPLASRLEEAVDEVLSDRQSRLGEAFRAIELMGYMRTALRAWKKGSAVKGEYHSHFRYMGVHVFSHQLPKLLALAPAHPAVAAFLRKHESMLQEIAELPFSEFRFFPPAGINPDAAHHEGLDDLFLKTAELWKGRELPEVVGVGEDSDW